jgi:hypothetical protein
MYSDAVMAPFLVVARAIRVLTALARVCDEKTSSIATHNSAAVVAFPTCRRASRDMVVSR